MLMKRISLHSMKVGSKLINTRPVVKKSMDICCWHPAQLIEANFHKDCSYALLVLNTDIVVPKEFACSLWQNAKYRVLVDGGTNRWLSFLHDLPNNGSDIKKPDLINGDFDSVSKSTLKMFQGKGTRIEYTPDQNETDFTKALRLIEPLLKEEQLDAVIALQEHGTRFDHIMANINTLFKANEFLEDRKLYLLGSSSLTWLLSPGKHSIQIPPYLVNDQRWCSLIPMRGKTTATTKGLQWNLNNDELQFGYLVSTSNSYASERLEIETDNFLLWSMGIFNFD